MKSVDKVRWWLVRIRKVEEKGDKKTYMSALISFPSVLDVELPRICMVVRTLAN